MNNRQSFLLLLKPSTCKGLSRLDNQSATAMHDTQGREAHAWHRLTVPPLMVLNFTAQIIRGKPGGGGNGGGGDGDGGMGGGGDGSGGDGGGGDGGGGDGGGGDGGGGEGGGGTGGGGFGGGGTGGGGEGGGGDGGGNMGGGGLGGGGNGGGGAGGGKDGGGNDGGGVGGGFDGGIGERKKRSSGANALPFFTYGCTSAPWKELYRRGTSFSPEPSLLSRRTL